MTCGRAIPVEGWHPLRAGARCSVGRLAWPVIGAGLRRLEILSDVGAVSGPWQFMLCTLASV